MVSRQGEQEGNGGGTITARAAEASSGQAAASKANARALYELVTVDLVPVTDHRAIERISEAPPLTDGDASLLGFWWTEIGAMNQLISLWSCPDEPARDGLSPANGGWLQSINDLVLNVEAERYRMLPFYPDVRPGAYGNVFELRSYILKPGGLRPTIDAWQAAVPDRIKLSPIVATMYAVGGPLQKFVHIWAYPGLDERFRLRRLAIERGIWPPKGAPSFILKQQNSIMLAASFSPIH